MKGNETEEGRKMSQRWVQQWLALTSQLWAPWHFARVSHVPPTIKSLHFSRNQNCCGAIVKLTESDTESGLNWIDIHLYFACFESVLPCHPLLSSSESGIRWPQPPESCTGQAWLQLTHCPLNRLLHSGPVFHLDEYRRLANPDSPISHQVCHWNDLSNIHISSSCRPTQILSVNPLESR